MWYFSDYEPQSQCAWLWLGTVGMAQHCADGTVVKQTNVQEKNLYNIDTTCEISYLQRGAQYQWLQATSSYYTSTSFDMWLTSLLALYRSSGVVCFKIRTIPCYSDILTLTMLIFSRSSPQIKPQLLHTHLMAQTMCLHARRCLFGVRMKGDVIWQKFAPYPPSKWV